MTAATATPGRYRWVAEMAAYLVVTYLFFYLLYAALLSVVEESALPPGWRDPDAPGAVTVVESQEECGNGGCVRALVLRPPVGQTPAALAASMGLDETDSQGWRWYDPNSVTISAEADGTRRLVVRVGYTQSW